MKKTSVILPCYNEEDSIGESLKKVIEFSKKNPDYEFLFVDDGSSDKTVNILKKYEGFKKIKIISYDKNKGKGHAVRKGIARAEGDYMIFTDSDLAYSLDHLAGMKKALENNHVAIGSRALAIGNKERINEFRIFMGRVYNLFSRLILRLSYIDMQAGIKGFEREAAKEIFSKQKINDFAFDTEIIYLAKKKRYKIMEVPVQVSVEHQKMKSQVKILRDSVKMFNSLLRIKLNDLGGKYE